MSGSPEEKNNGVVFHASQHQGIRVFVPRPYWHDNWCRSGPLSDSNTMPDGALRVCCFFATTADRIPFYFVPRDVDRISLVTLPNVSGLVIARRRGRRAGRTKSTVIFGIKDRWRLERNKFSIYEFDASLFEPVRSGEYVAYDPVRPLGERRRAGAVRALLAAGWQAAFVDDLHQARDLLVESGIEFNSQIHPKASSERIPYRSMPALHPSGSGNQ